MSNITLITDKTLDSIFGAYILSITLNRPNVIISMHQYEYDIFKCSLNKSLNNIILFNLIDTDINQTFVSTKSLLVSRKILNNILSKGIDIPNKDLITNFVDLIENNMYSMNISLFPYLIELYNNMFSTNNFISIIKKISDIEDIKQLIGNDVIKSLKETLMTLLKSSKVTYSDNKITCITIPKLNYSMYSFILRKFNSNISNSKYTILRVDYINKFHILIYKYDENIISLLNKNNIKYISCFSELFISCYIDKDLYTKIFGEIILLCN